MFSFVLWKKDRLSAAQTNMMIMLKKMDSFNLIEVLIILLSIRIICPGSLPRIKYLDLVSHGINGSLIDL